MTTYLNRTLCDVLEEMRATYKTRNFASLLGLIEEAQAMGNRMESKLQDIGDVKRWEKRRHELSNEVDDLQEKVEELEAKRDKLEDNDD